MEYGHRSRKKSLPMQAFMLYMSCGGVQIFSMDVAMLLWTPFQNIAGLTEGLLTSDFQPLCSFVLAH